MDDGPAASEDVLSILYRSDPDGGGGMSQGSSLLALKTLIEDFHADIQGPVRDERGNVYRLDLPLAEDRGD